jgi:chemotaxis methyl-accepting protein methylase
VPAGSGMAFVIVQHLDPTRKGIMPELLQRATGMKVIQVKDRTRVRPDCVYVIPPNKDMSILHGFCTCSNRRRPAACACRSISSSLPGPGPAGASIGVILSGMGSDGTLGLRAIKEKAGWCWCRTRRRPSSTACRAARSTPGWRTSWPRDRAAGQDHRLSAARSAHRPDRSGPGRQDAERLEKAVILLRAHTGHDFSLYKRNTLIAGSSAAWAFTRSTRWRTYVRYLQENPQELDLLFKELLIGVTNFFRDPAAWEQLREQALPALLAGHPARPCGRGCPAAPPERRPIPWPSRSRKRSSRLKPKERFPMQIFATDLDRDAIDKARQGSFPSQHCRRRLAGAAESRFFAKEERGYRVRKEIREMVIFAPQNLIMDPPFTKLDILSCRNLLIYLTRRCRKN